MQNMGLPDMRGQVVLVTGAGGGIGAGLALGLSHAGASVVVAGRSLEPLQATKRAIEAEGGTAFVCQVDVADADSCKAAADLVCSETGGISALVNNAGVIHYTPMDHPDIHAAWKSCIDINLSGAFNMAVAFQDQLKTAKGAIVNIGSIAGYIYTGNTVGYSAAKGGLHMLTVALGKELGPHGVRVNCVAPGAIHTAMAPASQDPERMKLLLRRVPLGRIGQPADLVGPVAFLASPMSAYMTGQTVVVDGGYLTN